MGVPRKGKLVDHHHQETTKPQFFTVIVSPALQLLKLRLPKQFVKNHGNRLSTFAYLRVPNGAEWPVELHKIKHNVWLNRGWTHFAEYYSISGGCFLVFRYDGISRFRVLIFDTTHSEIDYSRNNNLPQTAAKIGEFKVLNVKSSDDDDEEGTDDDDTSIRVSDESLQRQSGESSEESASQKTSPADRVLQRAKAFRTRNPSLIVHIRKRNLSYNLGPVIPTGHCRTYFKENDGNNVMILRINERTWPIKCRFEKTREHFVVMANGWREFVLDNDLQDGDKFVFELIDEATKTYYAHLFRISEKNARPSQVDDEIKDDISIEIPSKKAGFEASLPMHLTSRVPGADVERVLEKAKAFLSDSPGFVLCMSKSYADSKRPVHIPIDHSKEYLKDDGGDLNAIVIHGEGEKIWKVNYCIEDSYSTLAHGWKKFRSDNHLEVDDMCVFKLIGSAPKSYSVSIFRANDK